ncbi:hypothetical protein CB1_001866025 [Camelus ferus]|nr:hypothetical protein CB1_001866025 [Camelus ferus]
MAGRPTCSEFSGIRSEDGLALKSLVQVGLIILDSFINILLRGKEQMTGRSDLPQVIELHWSRGRIRLVATSWEIAVPHGDMKSDHGAKIMVHAHGTVQMNTSLGALRAVPFEGHVRFLVLCSQPRWLWILLDRNTTALSLPLSGRCFCSRCTSFTMDRNTVFVQADKMGVSLFAHVLGPWLGKRGSSNHTTPLVCGPEFVTALSISVLHCFADR